MIKKSVSLLLLSVTSLISAPVAAQSHFLNDGQYRSETRLQVGLLIPFGANSGENDRTPRLAVTMANHRYSLSETAFRPTYQLERKNRIAFTLDNKATLMFNGRPVTNVDEKHNLSTGATIAIGIVAIVGIAAIVATTVENEVRNFPPD